LRLCCGRIAQEANVYVRTEAVSTSFLEFFTSSSKELSQQAFLYRNMTKDRGGETVGQILPNFGSFCHFSEYFLLAITKWIVIRIDFMVFFF